MTRGKTEMRCLEQQLGLRRQLGRAVSIIGVSAGLLSACTQASTEVVTNEPDTASFVEVLKADEVVVPMKPDSTRIYCDIAEQMPMFPGGDRKLIEYLENNVQYPPECKEACTQGRVVVTFVVERDGSISHAKVYKSVDPRLNAEALRVVEAMPKWRPGQQNGVTVAMKYTIPVTFRPK